MNVKEFESVIDMFTEFNVYDLSDNLLAKGIGNMPLVELFGSREIYRVTSVGEGTIAIILEDAING